MSRIFDISENYKAVCEVKSTRNGFNHECTLYALYGQNGVGIDTVKVNYINRTWERFEFETCLKKLIDKNQYLLKK